MVDSGSVTLVELTPPHPGQPVGVLKVTLTTGVGVATMEKTLTLAHRLSCYIVAGAFKAGATPPTDAATLAVFDAEADADAMNDAMITDAGDGVDLVDSTYNYVAFATKIPITTNKLRFRWTANAVNNATGTLFLYLAAV